MLGAYDSLSAGQFTNAQVMAELDRAGPYIRRSQVVNPVVYEGAPPAAPQYYDAGAVAQEAYRGYTVQAPAAYDQQGGVFDTIDRNHDGKISKEEFERFQQVGSMQMGSVQVAGGVQYAMGGGPTIVGGAQYVEAPRAAVASSAYVAPAQCVGTVTLPMQQQQQQQYVVGAAEYATASTQVAAAASYAGPAQYTAPAQYVATADAQQQDPYAAGGIFEGAVDVYNRGEKRVVQEGVVDAKQQVISGVRPIYTFEKVVEVPQVIVREYEREVIKPQLIERIIEVPKTEIVEREVVRPPTVQVKEQIVEVPQVHIEERVIHVPRKEIQERLIEIPKVEYVERIEYEDFIEYREVPVDKIVEVPEIEYHIREVEHLVPQTYIQEYYIDRYAEVPATQVQEVQRREDISLNAPPQTLQAAGQFMQTQAEAMSQIAAANGSQAYSSVLYGAPMEGSQAWSSDYSMEPLQQRAGPGYTDYDPMKPGGAANYNGYGSDGYNNPFTSGGGMPEVVRDQIQASIASLPVGSTVAVPKGTIRQGGFPGGSMGSMPLGSMPPGSMPVASMPPGGMPPGTMPPGSMPPGSMQGMPGYGQSYPSMLPPQSNQFGAGMPYEQSGPMDYGPFASRPPVPAY